MASDDFNRANETPLAGNWTAYGGGGTVNKWNLSGNIAVAPNPTTDDCNAYWNANTFGADQFSQAALTVTGGTGGGQGVGLVVRTDHAAQSPVGTDKHTHYRVVLDHAATNNCVIARFNAGASSTLKTVTQAWTNGDVVRFEITGFVLTVKLNGAVVTTFDDSASGSKIATGQVGISNSTNDTSPSLDNWQGGDLASGGGAPFTAWNPKLHMFMPPGLPIISHPLQDLDVPVTISTALAPADRIYLQAVNRGGTF